MRDKRARLADNRRHQGRVRIGILVAVVVVTLIGAAFALLTPRQQSPIRKAPELQTPIQIQARGRDFVWDFVFYGPDDQLGTSDDIAVGSDLRVPVGVEIDLHLESLDGYLYILNCPQLGLREIAVPDLDQVLTFQIQAPVRATIITDPMCGFQSQHDGDMGRIVAVPANAFSSWLEQQPSIASRSDPSTRRTRIQRKPDP